MLKFVMMVVSFVVANLVTIGVVYAAMLNKPVLKWLSKKIYKTSMEISEELVDEME